MIKERLQVPLILPSWKFKYSLEEDREREVQEDKTN